MSNVKLFKEKLNFGGVDCILCRLDEHRAPTDKYLICINIHYADAAVQNTTT
jgi:hypothetical protein